MTRWIPTNGREWVYFVLAAMLAGAAFVILAGRLDASGAEFSLRPAELRLAAGESTTLRIMGNNLVDLRGWQLKMGVAGKAVRITNVALEGIDHQIIKTVEDDVAEIAGVVLHPTAGLEGRAVLGTVTIEAVANGNAVVLFDPVGSKAADSSGNYIGLTFESTHVTVGDPLPLPERAAEAAAEVVAEVAAQTAAAGSCVNGVLAIISLVALAGLGGLVLRWKGGQ